MKPTIINHPFRTISLEYERDAPLSTLEQEGTEKYIELHNRSQEYRQVLTRLLTYYASAPNILKQCENIFNNLSNEYLLLTPMLHYLQEGGPLTENEINSIDENERVCYDTQPLMIQLEIFKYSYDDYVDPLREAEKEYGELIQFQEKLEEDFDEFDDKYFGPIVKDYEQMEINIAALDEDFDNFRGAYTDVTKLGDSLDEARTTFIDLHIPLYDKIMELNKNLNDFFTVLNKIDDGNEGLEGYSNN